MNWVKVFRTASLAGVFMFSNSAAQAQDDLGWKAGDVVLRAGAARLLFSSSATIKVAGNVVPGGGAKLSDGTTAIGELEYFATRNLSVSAIFGIPLSTTATGTGTLAATGTIGKAKYGIGGLEARYHVNASGRFSPFASVGVSRLVIFSTTDGALKNLDVKGAWGPVIQGGADFHLSRRIGLFLAVSYIPMKTDAHGTLAGAPVDAHAKLNPTDIKGGLSFRF